MIAVETWWAYLATVLILMSTPGPSQLLMLSNSVGHGFRRSWPTAAGDLTANFLQMAVASVGLAGVIHSSREVFLAIKWAGVLYLVLLAIQQLRSRPAGEDQTRQSTRTKGSFYWQGFITSAANPKAVIFFAALFPQFIDSSLPLLPQFVVLSLTYLTIDGILLYCYGKFADLAARRLRGPLAVHLQRLSGTMLLGAAILLGTKDIEVRPQTP